MKTIAEYKSELVKDFMASEDAAIAYGFTAGDDFYSHFSKVSIESILFGVVAMRDYVLARLFDTHKSEVTAIIETILPHRPKWYADKTMNFMYNHTLIPDRDVYDLAGLSDGDIAIAKIIKHAVAVENDNDSVLTIKVAGEKNDTRQPIADDAEDMLRAYLAEIKDAGVRIELVNREADKLKCELNIYYNVQKYPEDVQAACEEVVKDYIENLPFNGRYVNQTLIDKLQETDGVEIAEVLNVVTTDGLADYQPIMTFAQPTAGYYTAESIEINMIPYS